VDNKLKAFEGFLTERSKTACPNPSRLGCPSQEFLRKLAKHEVPIEKTATWIDHLDSCSECFQDFSRFSEATAKQGYRMRLLALGSVAALVCVVLTGAYFAHRWFSSRGTTLATQNTIKEPPMTAVTLHFEDLSTIRGENEQTQPDRIPMIARGKVRLSIYLPADTEPGVYTLQILSKLADKHGVLTFSGTAEAKDGHDVLHASADLSSVSPGGYYLAIRHGSGEWRYYRIVLS
jgi:hypothetical protein